MIAAQMATMERNYLKKQEKVAALTRELASQSAEDEVPARLYTYVRDELQTVPSLVYGRDETKTIDAVLEARAGAVYEKSYLLLAMLRQLEIPAENRVGARSVEWCLFP